jgi:hypothetical protein
VISWISSPQRRKLEFRLPLYEGSWRSKQDDTSTHPFIKYLCVVRAGFGIEIFCLSSFRAKESLMLSDNAAHDKEGFFALNSLLTELWQGVLHNFCSNKGVFVVPSLLFFGRKVLTGLCISSCKKFDRRKRRLDSENLCQAVSRKVSKFEGSTSEVWRRLEIENHTVSNKFFFFLLSNHTVSN